MKIIKKQKSEHNSIVNLTSQIATNFGPYFVGPCTFRLPRIGERDPYFGNTRSFYYELEKLVPCLIHLRKEGKRRGVTLVDRQVVENYIRSQKPNYK